MICMIYLKVNQIVKKLQKDWFANFLIIPLNQRNIGQENKFFETISFTIYSASSATPINWADFDEYIH